MTQQIGQIARATFGFDRAAFRRDIGEIVGGGIREAIQVPSFLADNHVPTGAFGDAGNLAKRFGVVAAADNFVRSFGLAARIPDLLAEWDQESLQRSLLSFNQINPSQED
jgi:hypothetical protein